MQRHMWCGEVVVLPPLCSGRAPDSGAGGHQFDPQPGHTEDFKNGTNDCPPWRSGLRCYHYDSLAGVRINGPVVLVIYPGNAVI